MKVERQFGKPERKEALLQNLGLPFVTKYLPDAEWNPQLLVGSVKNIVYYANKALLLKMYVKVCFYNTNFQTGILMSNKQVE